MKAFLQKINRTAKELGRVTLMEVCGGHTNVVMRYGIRGLLPSNVKLVSGPGCPVCVTSQRDIDGVVELALSGVKVYTYGDMVRVPGTRMSLSDAKAQGARVEIVYSAQEVLKKSNGVFFGVGFETTTPMTAYLLKNNVTVYSSHKVMMPAMKALLQGELRIDGFILPGHVSTVAGSKMWRQLGMPQVISGFKPEFLLRAISILLELVKNNKNETVNDYSEAVRPEGNTEAKKLVNKHMKLADSEWRGLGLLKNSGLESRRDELNAKLVYRDVLKNVKSKEPKGCRCGEVLKGIISPEECPLFKKACTPETPKGACMVSEEGSCAIHFKHSRSAG
jgi:hydrogenase expression/formation protein HypD